MKLIINFIVDRSHNASLSGSNHILILPLNHQQDAKQAYLPKRWSDGGLLTLTWFLTI